jgi:hypothetical protein
MSRGKNTGMKANVADHRWRPKNAASAPTLTPWAWRMTGHQTPVIGFLHSAVVIAPPVPDEGIGQSVTILTSS